MNTSEAHITWVSDRYRAAHGAPLLLRQPRVNALSIIFVATIKHLETLSVFELLDTDEALICLGHTRFPKETTNRANLGLGVAATYMASLFLHLQNLIIAHVVDVGIVRIGWHNLLL